MKCLKCLITKLMEYGGDISKDNGYYWGKKWMDLTIQMWKEDISKGLLFEFELYKDHDRDWIHNILKNKRISKS